MWRRDLNQTIDRMRDNFAHYATFSQIVDARRCDLFRLMRPLAAGRRRIFSRS
jgi:hypothetical protein